MLLNIKGRKNCYAVESGEKSAIVYELFQSIKVMAFSLLFVTINWTANFFLALNFGSPLPTTTPPPPSSVGKLNQRYTGKLRKRENLLSGEGMGGAKSYDRKKLGHL
jgi:hypothetical protein